MSVPAHIRSRRALAAAASRLGRPAVPSTRQGRTPAPPGTPRHLRGLPCVVLGGGEVIHVARTFRSRLRGLLGTDALPAGHALLLTRTRSIHMLGMRFAIDLVWLDAAGHPVQVDPAVAPGAHRRCRAARSVLETPAGEGDHFASLMRAGGVAMITGH